MWVKSENYCLSLQILENQGNTVLVKTLMIPSLSRDKQERVLSDITKPRLPPSFWISAWVDFGHVLGDV